MMSWIVLRSEGRESALFLWRGRGEEVDTLGIESGVRAFLEEDEEVSEGEFFFVIFFS